MMNNRSLMLKKVYKLIRLWENKKIPTLPYLHEVNPGLRRASRENYIYFTLPPSINFQRSSPAMWRSALKTWNDPKTNYLFFPEKVVMVTREKLANDLGKHRLGLQPNKHTEIWMKLSHTLNKFYNNDPRLILKESEFDVRNVLELLQVKQKKEFPYISGTKMANYWLYILSRYTDAEFKNRDSISVIPDTHVIQCSVHLDIVNIKANSEKVAEVWRELLNGTGIAPVDMHPILWNWSRAGFKPDV